MATWFSTTHLKFTCRQRTPWSCWTSHSFAARGEHCGDRASASISGGGCEAIGAEAYPSSQQRLLPTRRRRSFTSCVPLPGARQARLDSDRLRNVTSEIPRGAFHCSGPGVSSAQAKRHSGRVRKPKDERTRPGKGRVELACCSRARVGRVTVPDQTDGGRGSLGRVEAAVGASRFGRCAAPPRASRWRWLSPAYSQRRTGTAAARRVRQG